jgi:CHAD domain-containing protein
MPNVAPPRKWRSPSLRGAAPAEALARLVNAALAQTAANVRGVLESDDPEYLHQLRVGLRRLRALLRAYRVKAKPLRQELRKLTPALGEARDWDVFADWLAKARAPAALRAAAEDKRAAARAAARAVVASPRFKDALRERPLRTRRALKANEVLQRMGRKARKAARNIDWRDAGARHELRIRLKRLRYACDALLSLPPQLETLQDTLGELNDLDVAAALLADLGGNARLASRIAARERALIGRLQREWRAFDRRRLPVSARRA